MSDTVVTKTIPLSQDAVKGVELVVNILASYKDHEYYVYERDHCWYIGLGCQSSLVIDSAGTSASLLNEGHEQKIPVSSSLDQVARDFVRMTTNRGFKIFGYIGYSYATHTRGIPYTPGEWPLLSLMVPRHQIMIASDKVVVQGEETEALRHLVNVVASAQSDTAQRGHSMTVDTSQRSSQYTTAVERALSKIRDGQVMKTIVSRAISLPERVDMLATLLIGRELNTPKRSFSFNHAGYQSTGFSPELIASLEHGKITTEPLAGTRACPDDQAERLRLRNELENDPKEIVEHIMSVKEAIAELQRICPHETVVVEDLMSLEIKTRSRRSNPRQINRAENKTKSTSDATVSRSSDPTSGLGDNIVTPSDLVDSGISVTEWLPSPDSGSVGSLSPTQAESQATHTPPLDPILTTFYLDHVFSYLYPFYRPSSRRGGRSWILELLMTSSAFQQIVLSYSTYYYDLTLPQNGRTQVEMLLQAESSVTSLSESLQTLLSVGSLDGHTHCACRVLTCIVQHHRYEIITASSNWKFHFDAALTLFIRLLDSYSNTVESLDHSSTRVGFNAIVQDLNVPRQEAFVFSVGLMAFDDIFTAASSNQEPLLFQYHQNLPGGDDPALELEVIIGVKSSILRLLGQVASLNAKPQWEQAAGNLDLLELAQRASTIMESLTANLEQLQASSSPTSNPQSGERDYLEELRTQCYSRGTAQDTGLVSQI
ncbi:salicylate synthase [Fusarium sp. NRRL 52700]|nr:salicylate synthase [Fusarium sp. NRRL 52700]